MRKPTAPGSYTNTRWEHRNVPAKGGSYRPLLELLEARQLLASDFGDAPLPYPTLFSENGPEHVAIGPMLGASRDTEVSGVHSTGANGDDGNGIDDEDG